MHAALLLLFLGACFANALGRQLLQGPAAPAAPTTTTTAPSEEHFIKVDGLNFLNGCDAFISAGWNQWEVVEAAAGAPYLSGASIPDGMTGPELVRTLLDEAVKSGLNTMRTWVHPVNPQFALQTEPGVYNEEVFRGLDYVLAEAQKRGIKLILAFTSNWTPVGGIPEYLKWAGATQPLQFYTEDSIKELYRNFVRTVVGRVNTINGRKYSEDPTIMAWNLINEPRCSGCPVGTIADWVTEMAAFVKQVDPNHLVTVGEDGFYGCCNAPANPGVRYSEWASDEGQDFLADHASPDIDFATFHGWVDNWQEVSLEFLRSWVEIHVEDAATILKKPVVFEEFGKWVNDTAPKATLADRNEFFQYTYDLVSQLEAQGTALKGALFWQWYEDGQEAPASEGGGRGLFGVFTTDEAFQYARENAEVAKSLSVPVPDCIPSAHRAEVSPAPDCSATTVNGEPGTGFEGPACDVDINECVRGTAQCDPAAACINTPGAYECICHWGYEGDGRTCTANERAIQELESVYWSQPEGLACDPGVDVEWPKEGPGYVYDPIDSFAFFNASGGGKFGSRTNVTLLECMSACQMEEACESFVYNDVLENCFLKNSQCPVYNFCWDKEVVCYSENDRGGTFAFPCGFWRSYYRLDMNTEAACTGFEFVPTPGVTGSPDPANLAPFQEFAARLAGALERFNPATETVPSAAAATQPGQPISTTPFLTPAGDVQVGGSSVQLLDPSVVTATQGPATPASGK